ncbi:MAG: zinc-binding alcohol dehydrogenase [Pseudomonadota bacterium]
MQESAHALVYTGPGTSRIEEVNVGQEGVLVRALYSGISRGTERLVFNGKVPESEFTRMRAPLQVGDFPFPVRYGYAAVGRVEDGPEQLAGRHVFCLHPHQTLFRADPGMLLPLPDDLPPDRAVLAANAETALNAIWDADLQPGAKCLIVGAGLLGWLIAALLSRRVDVSAHITDIRAETGVKADDFSVSFLKPDAIEREGYDLVFHTSASSSGLQTAIDAAGFEGRVIELSWYGDREVSVALGGNFHANRVSLMSSQVGRVASRRRASHSYRDRLALALETLSDPRLDGLITETVDFYDLPDALPRLLADGAPGIATRVVYP